MGSIGRCLVKTAGFNRLAGKNIWELFFYGFNHEPDA